MRDPRRWRADRRQPLGDLAALARAVERRVRRQHGVAHQGVPEPVAGLGRLDDRRGQGRLEAPVGVGLGAAGRGEQLVGAEGRAEQRHPPA